MTLAVVVGALVLAGARTPNVDDGFIVLVYARHLIEHHAIYWNVADGAVDGFTSVADLAQKTLVMALLHGDAVRETHALAIVEHLASVAAGAGIACIAAGPTWRANVAAAIAALAFATNVALADATTYWLETPLYALVALVALGTLVFAPPESRTVRALLAFEWTALALTRPEGLPLAVLFAAWFAIDRARHLPTRARWGPGAWFALATVAYLAWHWAYFGALAPNTFYAKSSDSRWQEVRDGVEYVRAWAGSDPTRALPVVLLFVTPLAALAPRWWSSQPLRRAFLVASAAAFVAIAEVIVEGGDSYDRGRFVAVPLALLFVALAFASQGLAGARVWIPVASLVVTVAGEARHSFSHLDVRLARIAAWPDDGRDFRCEMDLTRLLAKSATRIAETDFQRMKWFDDDLDVVDLAGLNDRARAHERNPGRNQWGKGGFRDAPATGAEVLVLGPRWLYAKSMATVTTRAIADDPQVARELLGARFPESARDALLARYVPAALPNACGGGYMNFFVRNDRAPVLASSGAAIGRTE